jgi:signal transduction histidine kinase
VRNPEQSKERPRILVVDDNEANRILAKESLEDEDYAVILANGGKEAIAVFEKEHPDCILLDVRMPDIDGFRVCEEIRKLPGGQETPVIFLTALRDVDTFDQALRVGGDDFLTKPVRPTEIVVRVQSALKLRQMRVELRDHYELLKKQRDDLMRVQLQKERLTAFLVHDLKNPVAAMDLHAQIIMREKNIPDAARESAGQIRSEVRQLSRMILNLLDLSKADEGQLSPKRMDVDLAALVASVVSELSVLATDCRVKLESAVGATRVRGDEDLLRRMLANLIENAIRHAPKDTSVTVTTSSSAEGTELRVRDFGAGVPAEMREKIFFPFVQLEEGDGRPSTRAGRGLGLAFCRVAATGHGGSIWVEDASPGSVFCVRLPHAP